MAGKDTSLTYSLYGKDVSATSSMRKVGKESESVGKQFAKMGKIAAAGLAVAGAAAAKFAYDSLQAAADDQKSQKQLALALQNTTKATKAQVKASEGFISKMQLTYGIADDKLRPALATLARGTGSLTDAQKLLGLAMDVSAGTGKDLSAVSLALVKAHNGNIGALKRLGIPLSDSIVKSKDFTKATQVLADTFGGAAKTNAETFSGRLAIMQQHLNESKEQIGYALMPIMTKFADNILTNVVPKVQSFVDGLTGVKNSGDDATQSAYEFGEKVKSVIKWIGDHQGVVKTMATLLGSMFVGMKVGGAIAALGQLASAFIPLTASAATAAVAEASATGGFSLLAAAPAITALVATFGVGAALLLKSGGKGAPAKHGTHQEDIGHGIHGGRGGRRAVGGSVMGASSYLVGENGPEIFTPSGSGRITPNGLGGGSGVNVVVNVQGSVIREKDLAVSVRDNIAILMRRQGLNPSILGV
jgi:hypothetical protein